VAGTREPSFSSRIPYKVSERASVQSPATGREQVRPWQDTKFMIELVEG